MVVVVVTAAVVVVVVLVLAEAVAVVVAAAAMAGWSLHAHLPFMTRQGKKVIIDLFDSCLHCGETDAAGCAAPLRHSGFGKTLIYLYRP